MNQTQPRVKCVIYDLDGTLFGETLFPHAEKILETIHQLPDVKQALATFNPYASFYCSRYGLDKYFTKICSGRKKDFKVSYVREIVKHYNTTGFPLLENECLFVDDDPDNIREVGKQTQIVCVKAEPGTGIQFSQIHQYFVLPPHISQP